MDNLTAKDYRNKHKDLKAKLDGLEARIKDRLLVLITTHPDLIIVADVKCRDIQVGGLNTIKLKLETIDAIELALSKLSPIVEQELLFK